MTLTPERMQYLELRATCKDCLLAFQVGDLVEFYDHHAETVARVCGLPLAMREVGLNERPIPVCGFPIEVYSNEPDKTRISFPEGSADHYQALMAVGYPLAVACRGEDPGGSPFWEIMFTARPQVERPPLRAVE